MKKLFERKEMKAGLLVGLLLCVWVGAEFVIAQFTGIEELGAVYGLLSELILLIGIIVLLRKEPEGSFKSDMKKSVLSIMVSAIVVTLFMMPFVLLINPELIGMQPDKVSQYGLIVHATAIFGSLVGVLAEGILIALIVSGFRSLFRKYTNNNQKSLVTKV